MLGVRGCPGLLGIVRGLVRVVNERPPDGTR